MQGFYCYQTQHVVYIQQYQNQPKIDMEERGPGVGGWREEENSSETYD